MLWPSSYCSLEVEICLANRVKSILLTATKNWVGIRGRNGLILILLIILWLLDRLSMAYGGDWPLALVYSLSFPFFVLVTVILAMD